MVRRPTVVRLQPRQYRVVDAYFAPVGQDVRPLGLALIAVSLCLLIFIDVDLNREPLFPVAILSVGLVGIMIIVRAPLWPRRETLIEVDLLTGVLRFPAPVTNGHAEAMDEVHVDEVDELLFAMRETPIDPNRPRQGAIDAFALYLRTLDGELYPVVEASLDHDRTFRAARFLADALDVGIKQVGKGWRS